MAGFVRLRAYAGPLLLFGGVGLNIIGLLANFF
jgi:hypothetical protein